MSGSGLELIGQNSNDERLAGVNHLTLRAVAGRRERQRRQLAWIHALLILHAIHAVDDLIRVVITRDEERGNIGQELGDGSVDVFIHLIEIERLTQRAPKSLTAASCSARCCACSSACLRLVMSMPVAMR